MNPPSDSAPQPAAHPLAEEIRRLSLRRREQTYYARYLQRLRQRQEQEVPFLTALRAEADQKIEQVQRDQQAWHAQKTEAERKLAGDQRALETARAALAQQQAELEGQQAELQRLRAEPKGPPPEEVAACVAEARAQAVAEMQATMAKKEEEYDQALFEMQRRQRQAILELENALAQREQELERVRVEAEQQRQQLQAELERKLTEAFPPPAPAAADRPAGGILEAERLQRLLAARNRELAKAAEEQQRDAEAFEKQRQELRAEIEAANKHLAEKDVQVQALNAELARQREEADNEVRTLPGEQSHQLVEKEAQIVRLTGELTALRQQLQEQEALVASLRAGAAATPAAAAVPGLDFAAYATELADFRRELEADRREVEAQVAQLRESEEAVEEFGGRAKVERACERAPLARARGQLDQLREEIRRDRDRLDRDRGTPPRPPRGRDGAEPPSDAKPRSLLQRLRGR